MKTKTLFFLIFFVSSGLFAQEICDNAIDDDGDNLIDLNDEDCICTTEQPTSLIPNPSFEERSCCPGQNAQLICANGWEQASAATTDYINTCGNYLGNTGIPAFAPLPLADGEGAVGFRDGQANAGSNYKEYVGACLTEAMEIGTIYRCDFFVGFQDNVAGSTAFDLAFFASSSCNNLPFGEGSTQVGCPSNTNQYTQLGQISVSGSNEWVSVSFEFTADQAYEVIVIGPSCAPNPNYTQDPYFYVDGLTLAENGAFGFPLESVTGAVCQNDLRLSAPQEQGNSYQWYFDNIALLNETNPDLILGENSPEGNYSVIINDANGCSLSQAYELEIPDYFTAVNGAICEGMPYVIGDESFDMEGNYSVTLTASDGCDSLIQLTLIENNNSFSSIRDTFCEGETFSFLDIETTEAGIFETTIPNQIGCDSIITLDLTRIDLSGSLELEDQITVNLGDNINIVPIFNDIILTDAIWFDENQNTLSNNFDLLNYKAFNNETIYIQASNSSCIIRDSIRINVVPVYSVFVPNIFTPNGDNFNDFFKFYPIASASLATKFSIFNRWGALIYQADNISDFENFIGWDGNFKGQLASQGVYVYVLEMEFLDGNKEFFAGDFTLLR